MRKLKGGHIIVTAVPKPRKSGATVVTFQKVIRAGRKPTYKMKEASVPDCDIAPPTPAPPSPQPGDMLIDDSFISLYQDDPLDCGQDQGQEDDVRLPRRTTVSQSVFLFCLSQ